MSKQPSIGLADAIRTALKRPGGLLIGGLPTFTSDQVSRALAKLCNKKTPEAFRAKMSHRITRYFDTQAKADDFLRYHAPQNKKARAAAEVQERNMRLSDATAAFRASNRSGYEVTEADEPKITRTSWDETKGRYYVDPRTVERVFSRIPLGRA